MRWIRLLIIVCFAGSCVAQSVPKVEVGIGYSYARMAVPLSNKRVNNHALALDVTTNVNRWLGLTGEFDTYYHCVAGCLPYSDIARNNSFIVMGGPRVRLARGKYVPWVHALGGYANMRFSEDLGAKQSWSGAAMAVGGGVDVTYRRFGFRLAQFDYLRTPGPILRDNFRITTGFVINLGGRVK